MLASLDSNLACNCLLVTALQKEQLKAKLGPGCLLPSGTSCLYKHTSVCPILNFRALSPGFLISWIIPQNWFLAQPHDSADTVLEIGSEEEQTNNFRLELLLAEAQHQAVASVGLIPEHGILDTA